MCDRTNGSRRRHRSADRAGATGSAVRLLAASPLTGVGPGQAALHWTGADGELRVQRYVHNEYLQVMTELGVIGGLLLAWLLGAIARLAWRGRQMAPSQAAWIGIFAGLAALAVHSAFDFIWHIPVIPLTATVLVAVLITPVGRPLMAVPSRIDRKGSNT